MVPLVGRKQWGRSLLTLIDIAIQFQKDYFCGAQEKQQSTVLSPTPQITKITGTLFNSNLREVSITKMKYLVTA